ncbi:hypothetical protein CEV08_04145 [Bartonella tribocorum]|uniref:Uncharacterized protein n=1 Tax=Bartonella tribocorum TaxID=85701 RepID=A0A2M6UW39_9HYPH|nr:hypothetical protein CEV08_04145 [Bartonella tribocorum]
MKQQFIVRIEDVLKNEFSKIAKICNRSGAQLLRDYIRDVVKEQKEKSARGLWFWKQVQIGIIPAHAGDIISFGLIESKRTVLGNIK